VLENREERDAFLNFANEQRIGCRPIWQLLNKAPMFQDMQTGPLLNAEWLEDRIVNIPSSVINKLKK
jgi:perosamine synthetase